VSDDDALRNEIGRIEREIDELKKQLSERSPPTEPEGATSSGEGPSGAGQEQSSEATAPKKGASGENGKKEKMKLLVRRSEDGKKIIVDIGSMGEIVEEVIEGIKGEIQKSVLIDRGTIPILGSAKSRKRIDEASSSKIFSSLGNEHRIRVLKELQNGGMYASELEAKIPVSASTLSNHLKILEDAGLITQEAIRGRYLITILGRRALRAARSLSSADKE